MLIDNTLFLRDKYPSIRQYFREFKHELSTKRTTVLTSKSGLKTIRYKSDQNKQLMVHSIYNPMQEAERIISMHKDNIKKGTHVFFYGIGLGYHIEKFHEIFPDNSYSVYEPVPEMFLSMTEHVSIESIITKKTRRLYIDRHNFEVDEYLEEFNTNNMSIHIIILPSYENIVNDKVNKFKDKVKTVVQERRTSIAANSSFQKLWVINSLINFKEVLNTPNILRDIDHKQFVGKPVIIVSAGPSLAEDINHLKYIKENNLAYLFAVGSAINSLIEYDVLPDAVCTYDPRLKNHLVYKKMFENNINDIPMLFGSSVGYETIKKYDGPKIHFITSQDKVSAYFLDEQLDVNQDLIIDSPSIAVMTFQVLNKLGANPIVFAGQNLGYLYDRRYSEGIEYDFVQSKVSETEMENAVITKDVYGNVIKTTKGFNNMRVGIETYAKLYGGNYINTTKGGAAIDGIPFLPIEEVIKNLLTKQIDKKDWWNGNSFYDKSKFDHKVRQLKRSIDKYNDIMAQFEILLNSMSNNVKLRNISSMENLFVHFDKIYSELQQNVYYANFLSFYIRIHVEFMSNELRQVVKHKEPIEKGRQIVELFRTFIIHCMHGSKELIKYLKVSFNLHDSSNQNNKQIESER